MRVFLISIEKLVGGVITVYKLREGNKERTTQVVGARREQMDLTDTPGRCPALGGQKGKSPTARSFKSSGVTRSETEEESMKGETKGGVAQGICRQTLIIDDGNKITGRRGGKV